MYNCKIPLDKQNISKDLFVTPDYSLGEPMGDQGSRDMGLKRGGRRSMERERVVLEEQAKSQWI